MDAGCFDRLARLVAGSASRRGALASLAAVVTGVRRATPAAAQPRPPCRPVGGRCGPRRGLECCAGTDCRNGRCYCPRGKRRCQGRCLPTKRCCGTKCSGGAVCRNDRCVCPNGKRRCQGRCIPQGQCCRDRECGAGQECAGGRCRCRQGFKSCQDRCIRAAACCGGCPAEQVCRNGSCCRIGTTAALQAALAAGPDTIQLCPNTTYQGTFTIDRDVTVVGAGAASSILHGGGSGPVVTINTNVTATLQALRVTGGVAQRGGGIRVDPGATLTLRDAEMTGNLATNLGGGIFVDNATLNLAGASRVARNEAAGSGGGIHCQLGTITLTDTSEVAGNEAEAVHGGGIHAINSTVTLRDQSRLLGNTARLLGGGIYLDFGAALDLQDQSAITGNQANPNFSSGGGIFEFDGTVVIGLQAVVSGNSPDNCEPTVGACT